MSWRVAVAAGEVVVELFPWFVVRTTGLPVRLLGGLGHPDLRRLTERLFAAERRVAAERRRFELSAGPLRGAVLRMAPERRANARRCLKSVRTGAPLCGDEIRLLESLGLGEWVRRWQSAVVAAGSARAAARAAHAAARLVTRREIAEGYDDESVRHAAFRTDPAFYAAIVKHPLARRPGDGTARRSRLLAAAAHRHLRGLAGDCGEGGHVLFARFEPNRPEALHVGEPGQERSVVEIGDQVPDPDALAELRDQYERTPWPERVLHYEDARLAVTGLGALPAQRPPVEAPFVEKPHVHGTPPPGSRQEIFHEERSSPYSERVTIGAPALAGLKAALSSVLPLWCLAAHSREERARVLRDLLTGLVARAQPTDGAIRLTARDLATATAGLWAGERPACRRFTPVLMAIGADLGHATWLLSDTSDDPLNATRTARLHSDPDALHPWTAPGETPCLPALDIDLGAHTPRIMIDDLVYQRARWRVPLPEERGADPFDRWTTLHRLCRDRGLPRHAFVRHPADPRPLYVDFCDPLAVEDLARRDPADVLVTEMLPAPGDLWWHVDGEAQCAEFHLACRVRPG